MKLKTVDVSSKPEIGELAELELVEEEFAIIFMRFSSMVTL